jgi:hypothetical protein
LEEALDLSSDRLLNVNALDHLLTIHRIIQLLKYVTIKDLIMIVAYGTGSWTLKNKMEKL